MVEDLRKFADLLLRSRGSRTKISIAKQLNCTASRIKNWEGGSLGIVLPPQAMLPDIARVYCVDLNLLIEAWNTSKKSLANVRKVRRPRKYTNTYGVFTGGPCNHPRSR